MPSREREVLANLSMPSHSYHTIIKNKPHSTEFHHNPLQTDSVCQQCPKTRSTVHRSTRKTTDQVFTRYITQVHNLKVCKWSS